MIEKGLLKGTWGLFVYFISLLSPKNSDFTLVMRNNVNEK